MLGLKDFKARTQLGVFITPTFHKTLQITQKQPCEVDFQMCQSRSLLQKSDDVDMGTERE